MTRRPAFVASLAMVALTACQCNYLRIEGDVANLPDGLIYLSALDTTLHWSAIDSTRVENGHFLFSGNTRLGDEECVILTSGDQNMVVFTGNANISIEGNALRPEEIKVSGSRINDKLIEFTNGVPGKERLNQIAALLGSTINNVDKQEELNEEVNAIKKAQADYIRKAVVRNSSSALGPFILLNHIGLFTFDEARSFVETFKVSIGNHKYVELIDRELNRHRILYEAQKRTEIGQHAPEIRLPNEKGDTTSLSSLRGNVVLIDFWRPGDDACRKNNQIAMETFNKFAAKGFSVVSISTDGDSALWAKAIRDEGLKGVQLIDKEGEIAELYAVRSLPASFLIDEDGIIVAKDVEGENIFTDIEARMNKRAETEN
ncbi:MAG: redoxin domain-containing protein [Marinilabiliaceae bacterium]